MQFILALTTPFIALIAVFYTRSQALTDEARRKQELFQIRYAFYQRVRRVYLSVASSLEPTNETDFFDLAEEGGFLFGNDIFNHIINISSHKIPEQVQHGIIDDWFIKPFKKYLQLK